MKWSDAVNGVSYEYQGEGIPSNWYCSKENGVYDSIAVGEIISNDHLNLSGINVDGSVSFKGVNFVPRVDGQLREESNLEQRAILDLSKSHIKRAANINAVVDEIRLNNSNINFLEIDGEAQSLINFNNLRSDRIYLDVITENMTAKNMVIDSGASFEYLRARSLLLDNSEINDMVELGGAEISYLSLQNMVSDGSIMIMDEANIDFLDLRSAKLDDLTIWGAKIGGYLINKDTIINKVRINSECKNAQRLKVALNSFYQ